MRTPPRQVGESQPGTTESHVEPDAKVVQRHPRRQSCSQAPKLVRPLLPQAEGVEQLLVDGLYVIWRIPATPSASSASATPRGRCVWAGRDDLCPVMLEPPEVVFGALIDDVGAGGGRPYAPQPAVLGWALRAKKVSAICWSAVLAQPKPVMTPVGSTAASRVKSPRTPSQAITPADVGLSGQPSVSSALGVSKMGIALSCPGLRKGKLVRPKEPPGRGPSPR